MKVLDGFKWGSIICKTFEKNDLPPHSKGRNICQSSSYEEEEEKCGNILCLQQNNCIKYTDQAGLYFQVILTTSWAGPTDTNNILLSAEWFTSAVWEIYYFLNYVQMAYLWMFISNTRSNVLWWKKAKYLPYIQNIYLIQNISFD